MSRHARLLGAVTAGLLASVAGAATVATFDYTAVNSDPAGTMFNETVSATDAVASLRMSGTLTEINTATWGQEALCNITAPDGQTLSIALFPNTYGFTGTITATDVITDFAAPVASAAGLWTFEFIEDYDDGADGLPDAVWDSFQINLESEGAPPLSCPPGMGTAASFTDLISDDWPTDEGGFGNSIVTADFAIPGDINTLHITGDFTAFAPSWRYDCFLKITPPVGVGSYYLNFSNQFSAGNFQFINTIITLADLQPGTGTWTIETFEDYEDGISPDAIWNFLCITGDQVQSDPFATDAVTPAAVARDGVQTAVLEATVYGGHFPESTGLSVIVDDSSIGGSGSLTLLDDGNFPDAVADDGIYTASVTVAPSTTLGGATLPYTVTDLEGRNYADAFNFTVVEAIGACCTGSGCVVTSISDCTDVQGGSYAGTGTTCGAPNAMTTEGAGAFEDISATGAVLTFANTDDGVANVILPFTFNFFGTDYTDGNVSTNGNFQFGANNSTAYANDAIPSAAAPNNALYVLWDDYDLDVTGTVYTEMLGTIGVDARFIIQWSNAGQYNIGDPPVDASTFQIALFEDGSFEYRYQSVSPETVTGDTTTIGFEDSTGAVAFQSTETRDSLSVSAPISFRGNSGIVDTGICGNGCPACAADYDNNGGVDGADLAAFFADYEAGETCSDVDQNGGTDGADLAFFFSVYEQGGC